ncbi:hypothetical protein Sango_0671500 [Sesamum angolense]|uniref:Uncharacterized protein n=1 Tax=Sesamum angolense TaxID=2727404 RepID=A0AAE1X7I6_9LAMI|nr:hypothetical protein Sango_0671500 [Sesamum angolense]
MKRQLNLFGVGVSVAGKSGGLALFWQKNVDVQLQSFSHWHIDVSARMEEGGDWWSFSGVYSKPDTNKRMEFWSLLRRLYSHSVRPWLCAGNFYEILEHSEKVGGPMRAE